MRVLHDIKFEVFVLLVAYLNDPEWKNSIYSAAYDDFLMLFLFIYIEMEEGFYLHRHPVSFKHEFHKCLLQVEPLKGSISFSIKIYHFPRIF